MNLDLAFKDVRPTEDLVKRLETKLSKLERSLHRPPTVRVTLSKTKNRYECLVHLHLKGHELVAHGTGADLFAAADDAVAKMELQVNKDRKRVVAKRQTGAAAAT